MDCSYWSIETEITELNGKLQEKKKHPCFSREGHKQYARIHLPVAPNCNIECNYCHRGFDCVNESRPGVCSQVLTPEAAINRYLTWKARMPNISVVGIAGPGDALANWTRTRQTIEGIKKFDENVMLCLSTNGLLLPEYSPQIVELGVGYVTVTINALDPLVGQNICRSVSYRGKTYGAIEGAEILQKNQIKGVKYLCDSGIVVKVNIVALPGINDHHIPVLTKALANMGVSICNIMPLIPVRGSAFAHLPQTNMKDLNLLRHECEEYLPQMYHCRQCRADAVGLLDDKLTLITEERSKCYA